MRLDLVYQIFKSLVCHPWRWIGCSQKSWKSWLIRLQGHSELSINSHWDVSLVFGQRLILCPSWWQWWWRTQGTEDISRNSGTGQITEKILPQSISKHANERVIRNTEYGYTKGYFSLVKRKLGWDLVAVFVFLSECHGCTPASS